MKAIFALLLAATLHAQEPAPGSVAAAAAAVVSHAESAQPGPAPVDNHAESAEAAESAPATIEKQADSADSNLNLGFVDNCEQLRLVNKGGDAPPPGRPKAAGGAAKPCRRAALQSRVRLSDGSILKGALRHRFLPAVSPALGRIRIDLAKVESIAFLPTSGGNPAGLDRRNRLDGSQAAQVQSGRPVHDCRITFRNGDRLTVRFPANLRFLPFDTLLGRVRLPLRAVSSISFNLSTSSTPSTLLYHCTFDDASSISSPAAGPAGTFLGGEFVPGKKGRALLVKARTPAAEVPFPTGLMQPEGCIEFWAKIPGATKETRYPDGGNPQFFAMGVGKWVNTFVKYTANDGFGTGGLHADLPGSAYVSSLPSWSGSAIYPEFLGNPSAWHHYALVWSEKGLDAASEALGRRVVSALYVDGRLVNPAYGTNGPDRAKFLREFVVNPVVLGFPFLRERQDPNQCREDFLIDEFKIWSKPKFDSAGAAVVPERQYKPELLYHCTFDSSEAIERPAAGPAGTFLGGEFVPGKVGNALRSPGDVPVAEVDLPKGLMQPRGTIEFWAKIEEPPAFYGDRGNPRFFNLWLSDDGSDAGPCSTALQFTANDGLGMSGLSGSIYHRAMATDPHMSTHTYAPILDDPAAWHHYAIVWDSEGLPFAKASDGTPAVATLVLDGRVLQTFGYNQLSRGEGLLKLPSLRGKLAFPVPADRTEVAARRISFLIDEFKIWSAPIVMVPDVVVCPVRPSKPELLYHCTFDSAEAVEHPAAGSAGTFLGGEFVPGKVGNALRSPGDVPVAEVDLPRGMMQPRGTIEFWAKIEEPPPIYPDRGNPLFFGLWSFDDPADPGTCSTHLGFCANNGSGMSGLCGMVLHRTVTTDPHMRTNTYGPVLGDPAAWHHYALVWDKDGLPFAKASDGSSAIVGLVLDGRILQTWGHNNLARGEGLRALSERLGKLAFPLPAARWSAPANRVPFLIDEFKIWTAPKTSFELP